MKLRIGDYLEKQIKNKGFTKKELYDRLKDDFHRSEDYVKYKGFTSRFYGKLYAEDLIEISYILGIDLNEMRDTLLNNHKKNALVKIDEALFKSKYKENTENKFSRWSYVENNFVYIVWFRPMDIELLDIRVEMYDIKNNEIFDISCLTHLAIVRMDKEWKNKSFEDKMHSIVNLNKFFYEKMYI